VTILAALRGAGVTVAHGIGGIKHGARPIVFSEDHVQTVLQVAVAWWSAVTDAMGDDIENRTETIAGAPAVLAAIGPVGHRLLRESDSQRRR
jgi:hypothetical protein